MEPHTNNRCIPQTKQHTPKGQMLFRLGNAFGYYSLATHYHIHDPLQFQTQSPPTPFPLWRGVWVQDCIQYHLHPFHFVFFKFKIWVARQHSTRRVVSLVPMLSLHANQISVLQVTESWAGPGNEASLLSWQWKWPCMRYHWHDTMNVITWQRLYEQSCMNLYVVFVPQ